MTKKEMCAYASEESCRETGTVKRGKKGKFPFWNIAATQFIYAPSFYFAGIPGYDAYRFDAVDETGKKHSFVAAETDAPLCPIWADLAEGVVRLTVTALNKDGSDYAVVGARTFCKMAAFPGYASNHSVSYRDCANRAYQFAFHQPFVQHWLTEGTPDPSYDLNTYPSKIISALVNAMLSYAEIFPADRADALTVARRAADWLLKITHEGKGPLSALPPTYYLDFCPDPEKYGIITANYRNALMYQGTVMMTYPASAGEMYLNMYKAFGDAKYLDEAVKIADYYRDTVEQNGSWYLVRSAATGEPTVKNYIAPMEAVVPFLLHIYEVTANGEYKTLADNAVKYTEQTQLATYNWEGQFEDTGTSADYANLTHFAAGKLIWYYTTYCRDDPKALATAKELMYYIEDQFVVWNKPNPWNMQVSSNLDGRTDTPNWHTPAALEQYVWYVPIDSSAASVALDFLVLYQAGCGEIYLAKAKLLMDQVVAMQHENGQIPTHWMGTPSAESNFWFNCMFHSCRALREISEYDSVQF